MSVPFVRLACALVVLVLASPGGPLLADRLHLEGGGFIDAERWWVEEDWVRYESDAGTVGVPRGLVIRIEARDAGATSSAAPSRPEGDAPPDPRTEAQRIDMAMRAAFDALEAREYENASSRFWELIYLTPDSPAARIGYAIAELKLERDGRALSAVLDGLVLDPDQPRLLELLGDLRSRADRVVDALTAWRKAFDLAPSDPLREKILKAGRELQARRNYAASATPHFNLRYDGQVDPTLAASIMDYLEQQYDALAQEFDHQPPQPITVVLYADREFRDVTRAPEWVGGLYDGKIRLPLAGLQRLDRRGRQVLQHELTHAVVHSKTRGNCPRWLQEGLAQRAEGKLIPRQELHRISRQLDSRDPPDWSGERFSYAVALSQTRYLEDGRGFDDLVYLLDLLGRGLGIDDALIRVYGDDYAAIGRHWARHVLQEARR